MLEQFRTRYYDLTVKHFHERLVAEHQFTLGYSWTKRVLQNAGLVRRGPRPSPHRKKRPRRPLPGMLLHQDGSRHRWLPALDQQLDLIVTMDDATNEVYSACLVEEERTVSSFVGLTEVIGRQGLFCSLYTNRGSHYFVTLQRIARRRQAGLAFVPVKEPRLARHPILLTTTCGRESRPTLIS